MKHKIAIEIDDGVGALEGFTDEYLAALWHVTQINPAPIRDRNAGSIAECVGREIVRRFCLRIGPPLWEHQGRHAPDMELAYLKDQLEIRVGS